jgi:predicted small integral membrane protein
MIIRLSKALLVTMIGLFALLVGIDNIIDYGTNFEFVRHVMSMDTTFPGNALMWRAVTSEAAYHSVYALIIAAELMTGLLATAGGLLLLRACNAAAADFHRAKSVAVAGLVLGMALWFFGFLTAGGEWFQMWQSKTWNGQEAAFRFIVSIGLVLIFLTQRDEELDL